MKRILKWIIVITMLILTPMKLFTVKIEVENDPTVAIATTKKVMINNYIEIKSEDIDVTMKEFCEKNDFEPIRIDDNYGDWYNLLMTSWWILVLTNCVFLIKFYNKRLKRKY